ncbi:hypothetical protein J2S01_000231 [Pectinatus haikarae]|uniref:Uncharacterized protein n=1 Tax=Pectinatus haikarae TaxID=349096 RepID=A0ABT9Y4R1_9FIRM|nr:hypothetical protein [Pectinatus haikarae]
MIDKEKYMEMEYIYNILFEICSNYKRQEYYGANILRTLQGRIFYQMVIKNTSLL